MKNIDKFSYMPGNGGGNDDNDDKEPDKKIG